MRPSAGSVNASPTLPETWFSASTATRSMPIARATSANPGPGSRPRKNGTMSRSAAISAGDAVEASNVGT